ncbi:MAG: UDP-N-acetylmuramate--L-alanine ligase, partial [Bacteroidales bacterium]
MLAHILKQSKVDCNAFLGGIVKNYSSNLMLSEKSELTVIEADEYDRSFHHLHPYMAVITSSDPDHLDIYGDEKSYLESFEHFTSLISSDGILLLKKGLKVKPRLKEGVKQYTYSIDKGADFHAENIRIGNGTILFDMVSPIKNIKDIELGVPVWINIENSIAAMAIAQLNGVNEDELRSGIKSYQGAKRRFDFWIKNERQVLIDDYGHHPEEVNASIKSVKQLFEGRKLTVIFQPHLYSRTKDFYKEFAKALSLADEVLLLDIYPAREEPIEGVTSDIIFKLIESDQKKMISKKELLDYIKANDIDVLMTLGAGDIDLMLPEIQKIIDKR